MSKDSIDAHLPDKRFLITDESMSIFKGLRSVLEDMQTTKPWLKGMAFFGSRTIAAERPDSERNPSDVDLYVFYDGDEYLENGVVGRPTMKGGRLVVEKQKPTSRAFPKATIISNLEILLEKKVGKRFSIMQTKEGDDEHWVGVDISKRQTDLDFADFVQKTDSEQPISQSIIVRFLLSVGDPVYENRKYILDKIATLNNPDYYASALMNGLQEFERLKKKDHTIEYKHFPRSLSDVRNFFLNNPEKL